MNRSVRILLIVLGTACVLLGALGVFVPVLPTTPFLLLAAACYARSSDRFYSWLVTNRWFGEYIRNYRAGGGIPLKQKLAVLVFLWLTIGYAVWFVVTAGWMKVVLLCIALGVTAHMVMTKTCAPGAQGRCEPGKLDSAEEPA